MKIGEYLKTSVNRVVPVLSVKKINLEGRPMIRYIVEIDSQDPNAVAALIEPLDVKPFALHGFRRLPYGPRTVTVAFNLSIENHFKMSKIVDKVEEEKPVRAKNKRKGVK